MQYYNKIIGGIILTAIGIFIAAISNYTYTEAQIDLIQCQSTGELDISPSPLECDTASIIFNASLIGFLIGILLTIIGLILLIVGIIKRKKSKITNRIPISTQEPIDNLSKDQEIKSVTFNEKKIDDDIHVDELITAKPDEYKNENQNKNEKIFCRYCGKLRPIESEYCARCGRSSNSKSENMKKCIICNSLVSEDSGFCSKCGKEF